MGGIGFGATGFGKDAQEAFTAAKQYELGLGGYTGTIAERPGFKLIDISGGPKDPYEAVRLITTASDYSGADQADREKALKKLIPNKKHREWATGIASMYDRYLNDKRESALCIELKGRHSAEAKERAGLKRTRKKAFYFFGIASC